jgi:ribulose kinase
MDREVLKDLFGVEGKVVVLTGGAGVLCSHMARGLGRAGTKPVILDINQEAIDRLMADLKAEDVEALGLCTNVLRKKELEAAAEKVIKEIWATGGFTRSPLCVQILSDVYGHPIATLGTQASSSLGAAFLAMKALHTISDLSEVRRFVSIHRTYEPHMERHRRYRDRHNLFQTLYRDLEDDFDTLHELSTGG